MNWLVIMCIPKATLRHPSPCMTYSSTWLPTFNVPMLEARFESALQVGRRYPWIPRYAGMCKDQRYLPRYACGKANSKVDGYLIPTYLIGLRLSISFLLCRLRFNGFRTVKKEQSLMGTVYSYKCAYHPKGSRIYFTGGVASYAGGGALVPLMKALSIRVGFWYSRLKSDAPFSCTPSSPLGCEATVTSVPSSLRCGGINML